MQTLSQRRAAKPLELLGGIDDKGDARKEFTQFCKSFPTMVLQNGLGHALAFIKAKANGKGKSEKKYATTYSTLNAWLIEMGLIENDVLKEVSKMDAQKYVEIQAESLRFLEWIKRYETAGIF
jgi:CRISPR-associated protein Cmr5